MLSLGVATSARHYGDAMATLRRVARTIKAACYGRNVAFVRYPWRDYKQKQKRKQNSKNITFKRRQLRDSGRSFCNIR